MVVGLTQAACLDPRDRCDTAARDAGQTAPPYACTAASEGAIVCPKGLVGWGYECAGGCWAAFEGGACAPSADLCEPASKPVVPAVECTAPLAGSTLCPPGTVGDYGYRCEASGCWSLLADGTCDAGTEIRVCEGSPTSAGFPDRVCGPSSVGSIDCPSTSRDGYRCTAQGCWSSTLRVCDAGTDADFCGDDAGFRGDGGTFVLGYFAPSQPDFACTVALQGAEYCAHYPPSGYGYICGDGCWSKFYGGPCDLPDSGWVDAGTAVP